MSIRNRWQMLAAFLLAGLVVTVLAIGSAWGDTAVSPATHTAQADDEQDATAVADNPPLNCRYGVYVLYNTTAWLDTFGAGWYVTPGFFKANTAPENGAVFYRNIRMKDGVFDPPLSEIDDDLAANHGSIWFIGNEIEVLNPSTGDGTYPDDYASVYHEAYTYIKQRDPSARVGIGSMSMATPARLQYLDIVWDTYQQRFGSTMPVDIWNIHLYILSEAKDFGNGQGDGKIALGTDPSIAKKAPNGDPYVECPKDEVYCRAEHDSVPIFAEQLTDLRRWMKEHGQQNKPLVITEWSLLFQPGDRDEFGNTWPSSRVNAFMEGSIEWLENARDPDIGYPADDYRLVQQWAWFSTLTQPSWSGYASNLIKLNFADYAPGSTAALTDVGNKYRTISLNTETYVNLRAGQADSVNTDTSTAELAVTFRNNGITTVWDEFRVTFYADADLTQVIGSTTVSPTVSGCSWERNTHRATVEWSGLSSGIYDYWVKIDSGNTISESNEGDNVASGVVFVNNDTSPTPTPPPGETPTPTPPPADRPVLTIPSEVLAYAKRSVMVPVNAQLNGLALTNAFFVVDYDAACLQFDDTDNDQNNVPDDITSNLPPGFTLDVSHVTEAGQLQFIISRELGETGALPVGRWLNMEFVPTCEPEMGSEATAVVDFTTSPPATFRTSDGASVSGFTVGGSVRILPMREQFLPSVFRPR